MKLSADAMRDLKRLANERVEEAIGSVVQLIDDIDQKLEIAIDQASNGLVDLAAITRIRLRLQQGKDASFERVLREISSQLPNHILSNTTQEEIAKIEKIIDEATGEWSNES